MRKLCTGGLKIESGEGITGVLSWLIWRKEGRKEGVCARGSYQSRLISFQGNSLELRVINEIKF